MDTTFTVSFPGLGIENITIDRVAFTLFGIPVYWYGILAAVAVLLGLVLSMRSAKKFGVKPDDIADLMIVLVPFMIVFARLYYVIFEWDQFKDNLWSIFNLRTGGLAFYGGVIGGVLAMLIVTKVKKISLSRVIDLMIVYVPLGHGIGRWGNFFNQEAFGYNTTLPWGMYSEGTYDYLLQTGIGNPDLPVHPTFLYEFLANMVIFVLLIIIRKRSVRPFVTTASYFTLYGIVRFFTESLRTDSLYLFGTGIRSSMLLSAVMVVLGGGYIIYMKFRPVVPGEAGLVDLSEGEKEGAADIHGNEEKGEGAVDIHGNEGKGEGAAEIQREEGEGSAVDIHGDEKNESAVDIYGDEKESTASIEEEKDGVAVGFEEENEGAAGLEKEKEKEADVGLEKESDSVVEVTETAEAEDKEDVEEKTSAEDEADDKPAESKLEEKVAEEDIAKEDIATGDEPEAEEEELD